MHVAWPTGRRLRGFNARISSICVVCTRRSSRKRRHLALLRRVQRRPRRRRAAPRARGWRHPCRPTELRCSWGADERRSGGEARRHVGGEGRRGGVKTRGLHGNSQGKGPRPLRSCVGISQRRTTRPSLPKSPRGDSDAQNAEWRAGRLGGSRRPAGHTTARCVPRLGLCRCGVKRVVGAFSYLITAVCYTITLKACRRMKRPQAGNRWRFVCVQAHILGIVSHSYAASNVSSVHALVEQLFRERESQRGAARGGGAKSFLCEGICLSPSRPLLSFSLTTPPVPVAFPWHVCFSPNTKDTITTLQFPDKLALGVCFARLP